MPGSSPFNPVSPQAQAIASSFNSTLIILGVIFAIVAGLTLYIIFRFRAQPGASMPAQDFGSPRLEIAWTIAPAILLVVMFSLSMRTMRVSDPPRESREPDLVVIAHQWWWELYYPRSGVTTANEIHLPVGRAMLVRLESADVVHDFWLPQLARKIDAVPGRSNHFWLQADQPGVFLGACAEFCGNEHAWMRLRAIAEDEDRFNRWQIEQATIPAPPERGLAADGARIFELRTCVNCHAIQGTVAYKRIGPDLTHLAMRQTLGAGALDNGHDNLARWLANPAAFKPGSHMPDLQLSSDEVNALVAYLESLH
jgi:cytochrome c oxidase subunit 2